MGPGEKNVSLTENVPERLPKRHPEAAGRSVIIFVSATIFAVFWGYGLKRVLLVAVAVSLFLTLLGCGSGSSSTATTPPPSLLKKRAFLTDSYGNAVDIVDAQTDFFDGITEIFTGGSPTIIQLTPDKSIAVVLMSQTDQLVGIDPATEKTTGSVQLSNWTESFVIAPDNKTIYAAVRNAATNQAVPGAVEVVDSTQGLVSHTIPVPKAHWIVLSHDGKHLLAFSDDSDTVALIDTAAFTATTVSGFDRPVWGVFSSDDSKAYIMNCGPECGGTAAGVNTLTIATATAGTPTPVSAATYGLLDGNTLYVAGTGAAGGALDVVDTGNLTVTKSGIPLTDGYHWRMLLTGGNLYVGARHCSNTANGCLAIVNVAGATSTLPAAPGDVTDIEPIPDRDVVYVVQGGELVIYDTTKDAPRQPQSSQIDIVGQAYGVLQIS